MVELSLGKFREMFADFVIVGRLPGGACVDISRNGMIKAVSEFKEYIFSTTVVSLGPLG